MEVPEAMEPNGTPRTDAAVAVVATAARAVDTVEGEDTAPEPAIKGS